MSVSRVANSFYEGRYGQPVTAQRNSNENTYSSYRSPLNRPSANQAYARLDNGAEPGNSLIKGDADSPSVIPTNIFRDFYQGGSGNSVVISAIKLAMMKFGHNPHHIYKKIEATADGFNVRMRDGYKLFITHDEIRQAAAASGFIGDGSNDVLVNAQFLYAVSAKRMQLDKFYERSSETFASALQMLSSGDYPGEALRRLGLKHQMVAASMRELRKGGTGSMYTPGHMLAVVNGHMDYYGRRVKLAGSGMAITGRIAMTLR
jgi:hypothetical protein